MSRLISLFGNAEDYNYDGSRRLVAATVNKESGAIERVTWSEILPSDIADKLVAFLQAEIKDAYAKMFDAL